MAEDKATFLEEMARERAKKVMEIIITSICGIHFTPDEGIHLLKCIHAHIWPSIGMEIHRG